MIGWESYSRDRVFRCKKFQVLKKCVSPVLGRIESTFEIAKESEQKKLEKLLEFMAKMSVLSMLQYARRHMWHEIWKECFFVYSKSLIWKMLLCMLNQSDYLFGYMLRFAYALGCLCNKSWKKHKKLFLTKLEGTVVYYEIEMFFLMSSSHHTSSISTSYSTRSSSTSTTMDT